MSTAEKEAITHAPVANADRSEAWFDLLQSLALQASQSVQLHPVLQHTLDLICAYTSWPVGHVYLQDQTGVLQPSEIWHVADHRYEDFRRVTMATPLQPAAGLPGAVFDQAAPVWMEVLAAPQFPRAEIAHRVGLSSGFAFPVTVRDRVVAILEFFAPQKSPPDPTIIGFSRFAGSLLGAVAERLDAEQERRASEEVMRRVVESSPEAFVAIDLAGRIKEWNPAAEKTFGWSRDEAIGRLLAETIIPEPYRAAHLAGVRRFAETRQPRVLGHPMELPGLRRDGSEIPLELTIAAVDTPNGLLFHAFLRDISERKRVEQEIAEQRRRLDEAQRLAHIGSWEWDASVNRVTWSTELYQIYGLAPESFAATFEAYLERVHPKDREFVRNEIENALRHGHTFDFEERIVRPNGEIRILHSRGEVIRDTAGRPLKLLGSCHDITEVREAALAAEAIGKRLQAILDTVGEGIYGIDVEGNTTFVNRAAARMLGWRAEDLLGRSHHQTVHHSTREGTPYPLEDCPIYRTLQDGETRREADDVFWRADGASFPVAYTATAIRDRGQTVGAVVTFSDITEQRRAESEARRALMELVQEQAARAEAESMRVQLHRLFEQAPAVVALTYGPDHVFELANPRYVELVGGRDIVGKPVREALPEIADQGFIDLLDRVYATGEPYIGTEVPAIIETNVGPRQHYFNFVYQPLLGSDQKSYGILVHAVDVTEQVRSRSEVEQKAAELAALADKLERTNRELDQFAYIASHDLKAPLRGVANVASWLEEDLAEKLTDETREYVALMKGRVARMEDLINALLTYSRAGRVRGESRYVDVGEVVADIADMLDEERGVRVVVENELPTLFTDPVGIQQVFQNLINNAVKYARTLVRVGVINEGDYHRFYVADDGPGIDPRFHDRIWGMFQRLHAPGEGEGTGIGLAIVRKIAEANHARTWVDSQPDHGATFWVEWPKYSLEE